MASETNMTACSTTLLGPKSDPSSPLLPKADSPEEKKDLELTVGPSSQQNMTNISSLEKRKDLELTVGPSPQQNMTNISSQNAVGVIQVI
jgi:hypothetical protein